MGLVTIEHDVEALWSLPGYRPDKGDLGFTTGEWPPSVDIAEDDEEYLIEAELPEVQSEDIKVTVDDGLLTISAERRFVWNYILPYATNIAEMRAKLEDGVLKLHLPKDPTAKPTSTEVKSDAANKT